MLILDTNEGSIPLSFGDSYVNEEGVLVLSKKYMGKKQNNLPTLYGSRKKLPMKGETMKYTIYAQNEDGPRYSLATIEGDNAEQVIDMLFDYQEWSQYEIMFDTIWAESD